jgi:hypothetical protein
MASNHSDDALGSGYQLLLVQSFPSTDIPSSTTGEVFDLKEASKDCQLGFYC